MVLFGGSNLNTGNDTPDLAFLKKGEDGWAWTVVKEHQPYVRRNRKAAADAPAAAEPSEGGSMEGDAPADPAGDPAADAPMGDDPAQG